MAQNDETKAADTPEDAPAVEEQPEPRVGLAQWSSRNAFRLVDGERVPAKELMGGFVHTMRQQGRLAAPASDFERRWKKFQRE